MFENLDPESWVDAVAQIIDFKIWGARIAIAALFVGVVRWAIVPFIRAMKGKPPA